MSAVIYGVPVGANYNDFHAKSVQAAQYFSESLTSDEYLNLSWTGLDQNAVDAYQSCLNSEVFNVDGLHAAVVSATDQQVAIKVRWFQSGNFRNAKVKWSPASLNTMMKKQFPNGISPSTTAIVLDRPATGTMIVVGNYNGSSTDPIVITPIIKPAPLPICPSMAGIYHSAGNGITMTMTQNLCSISSSFEKDGVSHTMLGTYNPQDKNFTYALDRFSNGCVVQFHGHIDLAVGVGYSSHVVGTSGACGFSKDWTEDLIWAKVG